MGDARDEVRASCASADSTPVPQSVLSDCARLGRQAGRQAGVQEIRRRHFQERSAKAQSIGNILLVRRALASGPRETSRSWLVPSRAKPTHKYS